MGWGWMMGPIDLYPGLSDALEDEPAPPKFLDRDHVVVEEAWGMGGGPGIVRVKGFTYTSFAGLKFVPVEFDDEPGVEWEVPIAACKLG